MIVFVDTSALYALLDEDDANHLRAVETLGRLKGAQLLTHAYVVVETLALVSRRLGWPAAERLLAAILPLINVTLVDAALHEAALAAYREARSATISFVDRTSFTFMRGQGIELAFAFDTDFTTAGFQQA